MLLDGQPGEAESMLHGAVKTLYSVTIASDLT